MKMTIRQLQSDENFAEIANRLSKISPHKATDRQAELYAIALRKTGKENEALEFLEKVLEKGGKNYPRSVRIVSRILCVVGKYDQARQILEKAFNDNPTQYWYYLSIGDIYYYFAGDHEKALEVYKKGLEIGKEHLRRDILSIYRYLLKRISHNLFKLERYSEAVEYFEEFKKLEPSNFYETDFVLLGICYEKSNQMDKAYNIWEEGTKRRKGNKCLNEIERVFPEKAKGITLKPPFKAKPGSIKIPVKTKIITEEDDASKIITNSVKDIAKHGDIITFASAVAAITQARIMSAETINAGWWAKTLSGFVTASSKNSFATTSPLANPLSFQVAIDIAGLAKILTATIIGAFGKIFRIKGWFYHIAGPEVAMIDDMPASMAPYDYFVIPGPYDSNRLAQRIKQQTGFDTAIIDANDMGIAWAVGASKGVNTKELEQFMADNPAGNEDNQTPIIIVRKEQNV
jgi:tetratricopeptide (TPR) repeat protein